VTETTTPGSPAEKCPLCASAIEAEQDWCLTCGGAARTRLAATPNWRGPVAAMCAVIAVSLAVLAAAAVSLAGSG
jgi:hypothetical protein